MENVGHGDYVRSDARRGGDTLRYHTWPTVQHQTVAHHSWNLMRILVTIWPMIGAPAMWYAAIHDSGELASGDPPFPVKIRNPVMKETFDQIEAELQANQGLFVPTLSDLEKARVKTCDYIEMLEFGMDEVTLGNKFGAPVIANMRVGIVKRMDLHTLDDQKLIRAYVADREDRFTRQLAFARDTQHPSQRLY